MPPKRYFIAATGTGIGKTLLTAALTHQYTQAGYKALALKPLISGFSYDDTKSDSAILLQSMKVPVTPSAIDRISPWRYIAPLSPHLAAPNAPTLSEVVAFCQDMQTPEISVTLVESAGGIMTPFSYSHTMLDLAEALGWPLLLVCGTYLGAISHTLTALKAMQTTGIKPHGLIISESTESALTPMQMAESIQAFAGDLQNVYSIPRIEACHRPWEHVPPLGELCS